MPSLNRVQLIGRLGKEPETRFTPKGSKVTHFSVAVDRRWRNADGEVQRDTDWFNIEVWGKLGEICQSYLHKGSLVYLDGRLNIDHYEQGGETRYYTKIVLREMQMLERKPEEETALVEEDIIPEE
jgi:single-strand DNA-binding protein